MCWPPGAKPWLVIDPKPHVGDPTYDPLQHMLNWQDRLAAAPAEFVRRMAGLLHVDAGRLRLWLFAGSARTTGQVCPVANRHSSIQEPNGTIGPTASKMPVVPAAAESRNHDTRSRTSISWVGRSAESGTRMGPRGSRAALATGGSHSRTVPSSALSG